MGILSWLGAASVSKEEIRAEVWKLGVRHRGWALEGALEELKDTSLPPERAQLLRACVKTLKSA